MSQPFLMAALSRSAPIILFSLAGACSPEKSTSPLAASVAIREARVGADPNAYYTFADSVNVAATGAPPSWSLAGIRGDGRLKTGATSPGSPSNEYQGDYCGVYAVISFAQQQKGTFNTDPDINWTSTMQSACGAARLFSFYLGGLNAAPTIVGPHSVIDSLAVLSVGQISSRQARFGVQLTNCDGIRFGNEYPGSNDAKLTRLADVTTSTGAIARQWRVESQGTHNGACVIRNKAGAIVANGVIYYLPFAMTIVEVPQPAPKFP